MESLDVINVKPVLFRLVKRNSNPAVEGRHYPGLQKLPNEEVIYDPATKTNRTIRYAPGESSIYKDEQSPLANITDILFINGSLTVEYTNPLLLDYLQKSNFNAENPFRLREKEAIFVEYNPEKAVAAEVDNELLTAQAITLITTLEWDQLKGYARVLGIDVNRSVKEVKHDLILFAKRYPKQFIEGIDDPLVGRQQVVMEALDNGIVKLSARTIFWNEKGKAAPIITAPIGMSDPIRYFTEWTMGDKEGEKVYLEIQKRVEKITS